MSNSTWLLLALSVYIGLAIWGYNHYHTTSRKGKYLKKALLYMIIYNITLALTITATLIDKYTGFPQLPFYLLAPILGTGAFCDFVLTKKGLALGAQERNPVMKWMISKLGNRSCLIVTLAFIILLAWISSHSSSAGTGYTLITIYAGVISNNSYQLRKLRNKRKHALTIWSGG